MILKSIEFSLIVTGILIMAYANYVSMKIYLLFASESSWFSFGSILKKIWGALPGFTLLFLMGYSTYLVLFIRKSTEFNAVLIPIIFFLGAFFVLMIVVSNYKMFILMKSATMVKKIRSL